MTSGVVVRSHEVSSIELARFISTYEGNDGSEFRESVARHFNVSIRTVETELPRHVGLGHLEVETLPGRGAPKRYSVSPAFMAEISHDRGLRRLVDLLARGDLPQTETPYVKVIRHLGDGEYIGETAELVKHAFMQGWMAFCPVCLRCEEIWVEPTDADPGPVCSSHPTAWDEQNARAVPRYMVSAWTTGLVQVDAESEPSRGYRSSGWQEHQLEMRREAAIARGAVPHEPPPEAEPVSAAEWQNFQERFAQFYEAISKK